MSGLVTVGTGAGYRYDRIDQLVSLFGVLAGRPAGRLDHLRNRVYEQVHEELRE